MANSNGWGDGAANNTIGWGQGANNNIGWGDSHAKSWAGLTDIVGITTDADAQAFITAAAITDTTQKTAINSLVVGMKADGTWTKMKAIYPFVGGTATTHKWNLKDPRDLDAAFRLSFGGGWTHSANGSLSNGVNAYANTFLNPVNSLTAASYNYSFYSRNQFSGNSSIMGAQEVYQNEDTGNEEWFGTMGVYLSNFLSRTTIQYDSDGSVPKIYSSTNTVGFFNVNNDSSTISLYKNGAAQTLTGLPTSVDLPSVSIALATIQRPNGGYQIPSPIQLAFSTIGDKLTPTESANLYTRIQTFNQALERQVGVPIVSDSDAQAFLNSAEITNVTEANAINTLVSDLKAQGLWTKMKAVYPFVGGTASTHKYNLKDPRDLDAAYRLVFNGGWTHSSTGALPNGTNAYADTKLVPSSVLALNSTHISTYLRTNVSGLICDMSVIQDSVLGVNDQLNIYPRFADEAYFRVFDGSTATVANTNSQGLFVANRINSTQTRNFKNATLTIKTVASGVISTSRIILGAGGSSTGNPAAFSTRQTAFSTIGDGLNDTEAVALYNAVQTYQTSLSRNV